ncbi:hypothetical protein AAT19DRAFT_12076 [Rhodotorula toruloides]|uniref:Uncharacterized protein n=1 Tax=Rhodotorula toruloides TaxID=5286 RepID=A0A2T0AF87_RHOTO|nr:hypothetical protein AAT19DRAFT_12076 [Rhodotorula toruloides]
MEQEGSLSAVRRRKSSLSLATTLSRPSQRPTGSLQYTMGIVRSLSPSDSPSTAAAAVIAGLSSPFPFLPSARLFGRQQCLPAASRLRQIVENISLYPRCRGRHLRPSSTVSAHTKDDSTRTYRSPCPHKVPARRELQYRHSARRRTRRQSSTNTRAPPASSPALPLLRLLGCVRPAYSCHAQAASTRIRLMRTSQVFVRRSSASIDFSARCRSLRDVVEVVAMRAGVTRRKTSAHRSISVARREVKLISFATH